MHVQVYTHIAIYAHNTHTYTPINRLNTCSYRDTHTHTHTTTSRHIASMLVQSDSVIHMFSSSVKFWLYFGLDRLSSRTSMAQ